MATEDQWQWLATIEDAINSAFDPIASAVTSVIFYAPTIGGVSFPLIVLWLVVAAIVFTIYFKGSSSCRGAPASTSCAASSRAPVIRAR